jgi:hypothetical protein
LILFLLFFCIFRQDLQSSHAPLRIVASSIEIRIDRTEATRRLGRGWVIGD